MSGVRHASDRGDGELGRLLDDTAAMLERSFRNLRAPLGVPERDNSNDRLEMTLVTRIESLSGHLRSAIRECERCRKRLAVIEKNESKLRREQGRREFSEARAAQERQLRFAQRKRVEILNMMSRVMDALNPSATGPSAGPITGFNRGGHSLGPFRLPGGELRGLLSLGALNRGMRNGV